jgi:ABC-2 type transport system permease protein
MQKILSIALTSLRIFFKDRGNVIGLLVVPIGMTILIGLSLGGTTSQLRVDVLDKDNTAISKQFVEALGKVNASLIVCPDQAQACDLGDKPFSEELAAQRLKEKTSLAIIEIPAGFAEAAVKGDAASIMYRSNEDATSPSYILQAVQAAAGRLSGSVVAARVATTIVGTSNSVQFKDDADKAAFGQAVYDSASKIWAANPISVKYSETARTDSESNTQQGFGQSVPGMGSMFVMFTVFTGMLALIQERKNWTFQRMLMMPITRGQIIAGKIVAWFVLGIIQYAVVFVVGFLVRVKFGSDPFAILLVMMSFTLCITALTFALVTLLRTEQQANSVSLLLSITLAPLGGAWWSLDIVPPFMRTVAHISPVAWAMDSYRSLIFEHGSLSTVMPAIGVLLAMSAVFFAFAIWRFKYE